MTTYSEEVQNKVAKQVDFYFSDSNLPKDRFLKGKIAEDPEGYVPLKIIIAFARMREMLNVTVTEPNLVPDDVVAAVASILKEKCHGLQLDPTATKLRRSEPMANDTKLQAEIDARSLFVKPFPHDADIDKLTAFFGEHATVNCVRLRRHTASKAFKGSVFVEFSSPEEADKVLTLDSLVYAGAGLRREKKVEYLSRKRAERKTRQTQGKDHDEASSNDELSDGVGGKVKDAFKGAPGGGRKRAREEDQEALGGEGDDGEGEASPAAGASGSTAAAAARGFTLDPGQILGFSLSEELPQSAHTHMIANALGGRPTVRFVELLEDRKGGYVRFSSKENASAALAAFTAKPEADQVLCAQKAVLRSISEEEEQQFMERAKSAHENSQQGGGRGGRGGRGGGRGGGGRHGHGRRGGGRGGGRRGGGRGRR